MAKALAAALATSAVATLNNTVWQVSDHLGTPRLLVATFGSIVLLVAWLVIEAIRTAAYGRRKRERRQEFADRADEDSADSNEQRWPGR
jgi:lysylphosphatidylglycerol synthetase-like protein (DUF2156 family)